MPIGTKPFSSCADSRREVNGCLEWDVEELTDAIQRRRTRLKTIDIIDLVLWKVRLSYSDVNVVLTCAHS
jgi:hypothetical protein